MEITITRYEETILIEIVKKYVKKDYMFPNGIPEEYIVKTKNYYTHIIQKLLNDDTEELEANNKFKKEIIQLAKKHKHLHEEIEEEEELNTNFNIELDEMQQESETLDKKDVLHFFNISEEAYERNENYRKYVNSDEYKKAKSERDRKFGRLFNQY